MVDQPVYITKEGLEKVKQELHDLKTVKRREIAERIEKAKDLGDLSENAEYAEAKDEQAFAEGRILELQDIVNRSVIIEESRKTGVVTVGSTVRLKTADGKEKTYTIVGSNEADPFHGRISNETPLAQALLGRTIGEKAEITVPSGKVIYTVEAVM